MRNGFIIFALLAGFLAGCGDGNGSSDTPEPTSTPTVVAATPTPTATPPVDEHEEILVGSTTAGGGELRLAPEFNGTVEVPFDQCLGGGGDDCSGGTQLFVASSPGFESLTSSEPDEGIYALPDETLVRLVLVSAPPGTVLKFANTVLDQTGESAVLGFVPFHADVEWQIAVAGGEEAPHHVNVTVRLITTSSSYSSSQDITLRLEPVQHDDHEHEHE